MARHLSAAATCLNAGWDLLQTHVTTKTPCMPAARSLWAPIITSVPVTAAPVSAAEWVAARKELQVAEEEAVRTLELLAACRSS